MEERTSGKNDRAHSLVPTIALPKGGGALHSIGEKFQTSSVTGTGAHSVPVAVSPGRGGFGPQLSLTYDSGAGNGPFGLGWSIDVPSIRRKTQKGLPRYEDELASDTFVLAGAEDLVPTEVVTDERYSAIGDQRHTVYRYRPRVEGLFARIERWVRIADADTHWRVITGDNVTTIYGERAASRIADGSRIFEWLLERTYDDRGNVVEYDYKPEDDSGIDPQLPQEYARLRDGRSFSQRYCKRIRYGNSLPYLQHREDFDLDAWQHDNQWFFELVFDYGDHALDATPEELSEWPVRRDPFSSYRAGFEIRTYRLCQRILMFHRFGDARLVRSTELHYDEADGRIGNPIATQLIEIVHASFEPGQPPALTPGVRFSYSRAEISTELATVSSRVIHQLPDDARTRWIDLDGEGLDGILAQYEGGWFFQRSEGNGQFGTPALVPSIPSLAASGGAGYQLVDLSGNGRLDLVMWSPGLAGSCERTTDATWKPFVPFQSVPNLDWDDPRLRLIDLTGDGLPDVLVTEHDCFCWYPAQGDAGYGAAQRIAKALDEERGPAIVFADQTESIFLADMCGDGLTSIVRIRNGEVCYWPNTGYGTFGARVTMDRAPYFDDPCSFDPRRIRLGDIDGTGTSDIFYVGDGTLRYWRNQAGNSWSDEAVIDGLPRVDNVASINVLDLLGNGTACAVWTSTLPADEGVPLRYLPLMSRGKPFLLEEIDNGMGAVTKVAYAPSTKFYLQDRRDGRSWITTLPFPVHVVERVETFDAIARNRFVTRYAYHHGFFDGVEREFRGFGMVEQWDTENYSELGVDGLFPVGGNYRDEASHVPPVYTRTWFHTGFYEEGGTISRQYEREYYDGDSEAWPLADTVLPAGLTSAEQREACRALKGRVLRQEVYALDRDDRRRHPYTVAENNYQIRVLQPRTAEDAAVIYVGDREALTYHYEREPTDPRIAHALTLEIDDYGTVRKSAAIVYPRRRGALPQQQQMFITYVETDPIHLDTTPFIYRVGLPFERRTFEIRGATSEALWTSAELLETLATASIDKRPLARTRAQYYRDTLDPADPAPFGQAGSLAIPHGQFELIFTQDILDQPQLEGRITPAVLRQAGYLNDVDEDATHWWRPSGLPLFDRTRAAEMFYLAIAVRDPFGAESSIRYDEPRFLFPTDVTDPAGNITSADYDYRVLAPRLVTDANGNRSEVVFDTRGMVIASAIIGKEGETDSHAAGDDVASYVRLSLADDGSHASTILSDPHTYLQRATTFFYYDLFAWRRDGAPPVALGLAREVHGPDERGTRSPIQVTLSYSDGFGRALLSKVQAEDGPGPVYDASGKLIVDADDKPLIATSHDRWVGNGATVYNNKGLAVRTYEPFFDSRPDYTDEDALVRIGVSPTLHYDPLGRVIRTELADGSLSRVEFGPWHHTTYDANDTVVESDWYRERTSGGASPESNRAAQKAFAHNDTPARAFLDTLGRPVVTIAHNKRRTGDPPSFVIVDEFIPTTTELDVEGHPLAIYDGRRCEGLTLDQALTHRGNPVMTYAYAMAGVQLHQQSMDAGPRWLLTNIAGNPVHTWDRRHHTQVIYDRLQRPTHTLVDVPQADGTTRTITSQRIVYGDALDDAVARSRNLRGKPYLQFDGAGLAQNVRFDFKGNAREVSRKLFDVRRLPGWPAVTALTPDWSALDSTPAPDDMASSPLLEAHSYTTTTDYDALGRAVELTTADRSVHLPRFNKANLLEAFDVRLRGAERATPFVNNVDYNAKGQRVSIEYANHVTTTFTYDDKTFRLVDVTTLHGTEELQALHYTYDPSGNITEVHDGAITPVYFRNEVVEAISAYSYDALYRLVEARGRESAASPGLPSHVEVPIVSQIPAHDLALRNYTQHYDYDPAGNILTLKHVANGGHWTRDYSYHDTSNRLRATDSPDPELPDPSGHVYEHDVNGNILSMRHLQRMDWDHTDHLAHIRIADHDDLLFAYDAQRQRVRKLRIKDNHITERIYLGGVELHRHYLIADADPRDTLETLHVFDDKTRICMVETRVRGGAAEPPRFRYQLANHLGSATTELDDDGTVITYEEYHPYGTTAYQAQNGATIAVSPKRYRYTGLERDEESGLCYHSARYYCAWLGRWCTTDPSGLEGGNNLYEYGTDNPINMVDRTGHKSLRRLMLDAVGATNEGEARENFTSLIADLAVDFDIASERRQMIEEDQQRIEEATPRAQLDVAVEAGQQQETAQQHRRHSSAVPSSASPRYSLPTYFERMATRAERAQRPRPEATERIAAMREQLRERPHDRQAAELAVQRAAQQAGGSLQQNLVDPLPDSMREWGELLDQLGPIAFVSPGFVAMGAAIFFNHVPASWNEQFRDNTGYPLDLGGVATHFGTSIAPPMLSGMLSGIPLGDYLSLGIQLPGIRLSPDLTQATQLGTFGIRITADPVPRARDPNNRSLTISIDVTVTQTERLGLEVLETFTFSNVDLWPFPSTMTP